MSISHLYHTQNIYGFQYTKTQYLAGKVIFYIQQKTKKQVCQQCNSSRVKPYFLKEREIKALPVGKKEQIIKVKIHRLLCSDCGSYRQEKIPFISNDKNRYTKCLERYVIDLRSEMTISAVAQFTGLNWKTVKNIEKKYLKKKYKRVRLKDVTAIGIDEICIGEWGFKTIVIDLNTGAVLYIGQGRSADALSAFSKKIRRSKCKITTVAVDMAPSYTKWVKDNLPNATIVYDHFHVIKLMGEKMDLVRRNEVRRALTLDKKERVKIGNYCKRLEERARARNIPKAKINKRIKIINDQFESKARFIKGTKWLLLSNAENIQNKEKAMQSLDLLKASNSNIALAYQLKEQLRAIYRLNDVTEAALALEAWCKMAEETKLRPLKTMVNTLRRHRDGVLAYWETGITSAKVEGFNCKIRWLIKQAYGYHDEEYFELKVLDLPNLKSKKGL